MFLIFLMQALFALTFPIGKKLLMYVPPAISTGIRFIIAGICFLGWTWYTEGVDALSAYAQRVYQEKIKWLMVIGCYVYFAYLPEAWALQYMSAFKANLLWSTLPFISAFFEYILYGMVLRAQQWLGMFIGMCGALMIVMSHESSEVALASSVGMWLPEIALTISVGATAYAWFMIKDLSSAGYSMSWINGAAMLSGGIASVLTGIGYEHIPMDCSAWFYGMALIMGLVIISNITAYTIYGFLLQTCSITFLSFSGFLCPIFGAFFCTVFCHDPLPLVYVYALVGILSGLYLFYREELAHEACSIREDVDLKKQ